MWVIYRPSIAAFIFSTSHTYFKSEVATLIQNPEVVEVFLPLERNIMLKLTVIKFNCTLFIYKICNSYEINVQKVSILNRVFQLVWKFSMSF